MMIINYLTDSPEEASIIAKWYFDEWGAFVPNVTVDKVLEKLTSRAMCRGGFPSMLTLHDNETLCACAELKFTENKHHPEYEHWVGGVYVEPKSRGKGFALALVEKAKALTVKENIEKLYLQAEDKNIALYLKCGFKALHESEHNGVNTTIMVWQNAGYKNR